MSKHYRELNIKRLFLIILIILGMSISFICPEVAAAENTGKEKQLNFVFLHGYNGNDSSMQLLEDCIMSQLPAYIANYENDHPEINIQTDTLRRSYPNDVDIETWAKNIADSINERFLNKKNLVLIGHSMGGKTALYAVSHNIGNLADKVAMVVTINSPVKSLVKSYYVGGDTALEYWGAQLLMPNNGVLESLVNYDSSADGKWVSENKNWLAFISAESNPVSTQFDINGIDPLPRDMDDTIVPISSQYADGADTVYYGEYGHSEFTKKDEVSNYMAEQILRYIFGGSLRCAVPARSGSFEHKAGLFPGTDYWQDIVGGVLAESGTIIHKNDSFFKWQEWEDVVGEYLNGSMRSSFQTTQEKTNPLWTGIKQLSWLNADDYGDGRMHIITRAAPRSSVQVNWSVSEQGLLPAGFVRDHYEVEIETGTQLASVNQVAWATDNPQDVRLHIGSQAQSPFRWFKAQWRVYFKESRYRQIIDELPVMSQE